MGKYFKKTIAYIMSLIMSFSCLTMGFVSDITINSDAFVSYNKSIVENANVVFIIDSTGSMDDYINSVKENLVNFVNSLTRKGITLNMAVIEFRDIEEDGTDSTIVYKFDGSCWTTDASQVTDVFNSIHVNGGGDNPETPIDAFEKLLVPEFAFPDESADKFVFLLTDADYKDYADTAENRANEHYSMSQWAQIFKDNDVRVTVVGSTSFEDRFEVLYSPTGGKFIDIASDDYFEIMHEYSEWVYEHSSDDYFDKEADDSDLLPPAETITDPDVDFTADELKKIDFINQHICSAKRKKWQFIKATANLTNEFNGSMLDAANNIWHGVEFGTDVLNFEVNGVIEKVSANSYNAILLDMFNYMYDDKYRKSLWDNAVLESVKDYTEGIKLLCGSSDLILTDSVDKLESGYLPEIIEKVEAAEEKFMADSVLNPETALEDYEDTIIFIENTYHKELADAKIDWAALKSYKGITDSVDNISTSVTTISDYIGNMDRIVASSAYVKMDETYEAIMLEICAEADSDKYKKNSWETADLKSAIKYSLAYKKNYREKATEEIFKSTSLGLVNLITSTEFYKDVVETTFITNNVVNFASATFAKKISASDLNLYLAGLQFGSKAGVFLSDQMFNSSESADMYCLIKEYGTLEMILGNILDRKADELLRAEGVEAQYEAAVAYDYVYRMYMYVEAEGCDAAADYTKSLELSPAIEKIMTAQFDVWFGVFNFFSGKGFRTLSDKIADDVTTIQQYRDHANFIRRCHCHTDEKITADDRDDILSIYYDTMDIPRKIAIISCPVQVDVYNENGALVGSMSQSEYNVPDTYTSCMYRIEETDSNVVVVPENYTIRVVGLEEGTMSVLSGYYDDGEITYSTFQDNIPITADYDAVIDIDEQKTIIYEDGKPSMAIVTVKLDPVIVLVYCILGIAFIFLGIVSCKKHNKS